MNSHELNVNSWHFKMLPAEERITLRSSVELRVPDLGECRVYDGQRSADGYGVIRIKGKHEMVHKVMWSLAHGPVPDGHELHHRCENEPCWRPEHLEVVTPRQNILYSKSNPASINSRKTHCKNNHELSGDNLRVYNRPGRQPERVCKACARIKSAAWKAKQMPVPDHEAEMMGFGTKKF